MKDGNLLPPGRTAVLHLGPNGGTGVVKYLHPTLRSLIAHILQEVIKTNKVLLLSLFVCLLKLKNKKQSTVK